jgi:hypothetical protein
MAQDIRALGESLLAQAQKKRKKEEKKTKIFGGLMLGVSIGNHFLRQQAQKRMDKFVNSNVGLLKQRGRQFEEGVGFWSDHNSMMKSYGMGETDTDWENAFKQKQYDLYKQRELGKSKLSDLNADKLKEFEMAVDSKIQDDIDAYRQKLDIFSDFKNIKDDKESRTLYMKPLSDKILQGKKLIEKEGTVGNFLLNKLGFVDRGLEEVEVGGQEVLMARAMSSEDKRVLKQNIILNERYLKSIDDINKTVKYTPLTDEEISQFVEPSSFTSKPAADLTSSLSAAISEDKAKRNSSIIGENTYKTILSDDEVTVHKLYDKIVKEQGNEAAMAFVDNVYSFATQARKAYEQDPENRGQLRSADYFVDIGIRQAINQSNLAPQSVLDEREKKRFGELEKAFMSEELTFNLGNREAVLTPSQLQEALQMDRYQTLSKDNRLKIYTDIENSIKNLQGSEGFLNSLISLLKLDEDEDEDENNLNVPLALSPDAPFSLIK